jgi:flagellar motility protein MotE (MotC chaperone)
MKSQIIMGAAALFMCIAVTAQPTQQTQTRNREKVRTEAKNQPQGPVQVQDQEQYRNRGEAVSEQRHLRNAERKALKAQEKEMKRQEKQTRKLQKEMEKQHKEMQEREGVQNREQNMGHAITPAKGQNHSARPAGQQQKGGGPGKGRK